MSDNIDNLVNSSVNPQFAEPPVSEPERQYYYIGRCRELVANYSKETGRPLTYCVNTFGCQMNARDSEKITGILEQIGFVAGEDERADFVLYNTCTVRENANNKVYGHLGQIMTYVKENPNMMVAICGCMMQEAEPVERIKKTYPFVNLIFGTHNIYKFAELLCLAMEAKAEFMNKESPAKAEHIDKARMQEHKFNQARNGKYSSMIIDIWEDTDKIVEDLPNKRKYPFKSGINIMFGCNNFCSYCIVPYVRGRERSREPKDILHEVRRMAADGVCEVMLLGQNVNSYGRNLKSPMSFAQLLREVDKLDGIKRIRFMTSHPKDLSDELIEAMRDCKKVCHHLHLPLQSGSDRILKIMNRHYDKERYLAIVEKLRREIPDIAITTDIIVGFPGETEEDFLETM
ncbi:MAG: MiaB/RimO family radical SAM methylthiotransferase, partial [Clostridiales bacterium]|nr:MiaB/RimO family radical SAM methylthiotransferase [Clostridiales bacterium]